MRSAVDRVAEAIFWALGDNYQTWGELSTVGKERYRTQAKAAIKAKEHDPTAEIEEATADMSWFRAVEYKRHYWAMRNG